MSPTALVWFRNDLRLSDHPALAAAAASGLPVLCLYILEEGGAGQRPLGGASRWRLDRALSTLESELGRLGAKLHLLRGAPEKHLPHVAEAVCAAKIYWSRRYGGADIALDSHLKTALRTRGCDVVSSNANLLAEPWEVRSKSGGAFKVFTPFWRASREHVPPPPLPAPERFVPALWPADAPKLLTRQELDLAPRRPDWAAAFLDPDAGEAGAQERLHYFLEHNLDGYGTNRDRLDLNATSRLSAHLRFGEISPRQIFAAAPRDADKFLSEIGWREFSYHLLYAHPDLSWINFNPRFDSFPFVREDAALEAWKHGRTGYPVVDAAMRELWTTGHMHNRARMVAASFLTGVRLGETYPRPIIDHDFARRRALAAFSSLSN